MKLLWPLLISVPSVLLTLALFVSMALNLPSIEELGIPKFIGLYPMLAFTTCLALAIVFRTKEWRIGTAISAIPLVLFSLLALLLPLGG